VRKVRVRKISDTNERRRKNVKKHLEKPFRGGTGRGSYLKKKKRRTGDLCGFGDEERPDKGGNELFVGVRKKRKASRASCEKTGVGGKGRGGKGRGVAAVRSEQRKADVYINLKGRGGRRRNRGKDGRSTKNQQKKKKKRK